MKIRHYTIYFIQIVLFGALIWAFHYHNNVQVDIIVKRMDNVFDSIHTTVKSYPTPLFLPDSKRIRDKQGNYWLSEQDFEVLEKALTYHNQKVETACSEVRNEISNDITRLNTWISLWMGILAVLGVFVPIAINIASIKSIEKEIKNQTANLDRIKEDTNLAETKAGEAKAAAESSAAEVRQVKEVTLGLEQTAEGLASRVAASQSKVADLQGEVNEVSRQAKAATDSVNLIKREVDWVKISIRLVYSLGTLKDVENSYRIAQLLGEDKSFIIKHNIDNSILIFKEFQKYDEDFAIDPQQNSLIISMMHDFVLAFQKMQPFFNTREQLHAIEEINAAITAFLDLKLRPNDDRTDALQKIIDALGAFKEKLSI